MLNCAGCFNKRVPEESERWTPADWRAAVRENEQRLKSEDERAAGERLAAFEKVRKNLWEQVTSLYNYITGNTPFNAAKAILDPGSADRRRQGIIYLADREYGRNEPYTKYYAEMGSGDPDHVTRSMAVRALNRSRDESATDLYMKALTNPREQALVRLEAAKALANLPLAESVQPMIAILRNVDEPGDLRVAAADALRNHRTAPAAQALIGVLRDRNFAVAWQARKSLKLMTGKDFRYDSAAWLTYLTSEQQPFG